MEMRSRCPVLYLKMVHVSGEIVNTCMFAQYVEGQTTQNIIVIVSKSIKATKDRVSQEMQSDLSMWLMFFEHFNGVCFQ